MPTYRFLFTLALTCAAMHAQVNADTGEVFGLVSDPQNKAVPGARVRLEANEKGFERTVVTGIDGAFRFALTPPEGYRVTVEAAGFANRTVSAVEVLVGSSVELQISLELAQTRAELNVSASYGDTAAIDSQRTHQADIIQPERIENLPINRRNYLEFALLAPGVVETTTITDQADYRLFVTTPTSNLGFSGSNGRGNSVTIDGISINGWSQNVRPAIPQGAVQEFQVNRNGYPAEYGGASGGVVNIVSRSGGNTPHLEAFGLLRNRSLQARNYFDPAKSAFTRQQSGISLSGPLRKDQTYLFGAYERLDRHETVFVPIPRDPAFLHTLTPSQQRLTSFFAASGDPQLAALGALLTQALTPANTPFLTNLFATNSGVFPFGAHTDNASIRLDHRFNDKHSSAFRASMAREFEANTKFGALLGYSHGNTTNWKDHTLTANHTWIVSPTLYSVSRLAFSITRFPVTPNDPVGPEILLGEFGTFGRDPIYPFDLTERYWQLQQSFYGQKGRHLWKAGGEVIPIRTSTLVETYFGGQFLFGSAIPLAAVLDSAAGAPGFSTQLARNLTALGQPGLAASLAEPINSLQAFSLGLPLAYFQGFGDNRYQAWRQNNSAFFEDTWQPRPGLSLNAGLRFQYDGVAGMHDGRTLSPRFGFAWSPGDSKRVVVRGGYGIFVPFTFVSIPFTQFQRNRPDVSFRLVTLAGSPVTNPQTGRPLTSADIFQYVVAQGIFGKRQITEADLAPLGLGPGVNFPVPGSVQGDYSSPYAQQANLQFETTLGGFALGLGLETQRTVHNWRTRDINIRQVGRQPDGSPLLGPINPAIAAYYLLETSANAFYDALVLQMNRRMGSHFGLNAHYTWSKAIDDATDFTQEYMAHNPLDVRADRALSPFNQSHRFVASATLESPGKGWTGGWKLAPIFRANSARPFNVLAGVDNLGDGQVTTHRPLGLGRDTGIGPGFFTIDTRLSRRFRLDRSERIHAEFLIEAFNLLNRTNFLTVNNIVGNVPIASLPTRQTGVRGPVTDPFSFTSANDPRQLQIGIKIGF